MEGSTAKQPVKLDDRVRQVKTKSHLKKKRKEKKRIELDDFTVLERVAGERHAHHQRGQSGRLGKVPVQRQQLGRRRERRDRPHRHR